MTSARTIESTDETGTGPALQSAERGHPSHLRLVRSQDPKSEARASVPEQFLRDARRAASLNDPRTAERLATVGQIMANMEAVPFRKVAQSLGVAETALIRIIHGEAAISEARHEEWRKIDLGLVNLHLVLEPEATGRWLDTAVPALANQTPFDVLRRHKYDDFLRLTQSYLEPYFA